MLQSDLASNSHPFFKVEQVKKKPKQVSPGEQPLWTIWLNLSKMNLGLQFNITVTLTVQAMNQS